MILLDTNVLVGLVDPRDGLHRRATRDLARISRDPLIVTWPVLTETLHFLGQTNVRRRLQMLLTEIHADLLDERLVPPWDDVFNWMLQYGEHEPDFVDAFLVLTTRAANDIKLWSYDADFLNIWRRPDGTRVPMMS